MLIFVKGMMNTIANKLDSIQIHTEYRPTLFGDNYEFDGEIVNKSFLSEAGGQKHFIIPKENVVMMVENKR